MENQPQQTASETLLKILLVLGIGLLILLLLFFIFPGVSEDKNDGGIAQQEIINPFDTISLDAEAFIVWDVARGEEIISENKNAQLPLASVAKLMTAVIAEEALQGKDVITISQNDIVVEGDSGLLVNERWVLKDLIDLTLVTSSNDGAAALASAVEDLLPERDPNDPVSYFQYKVKEKIEQIGMEQTFFLNPSGLDVTAGTSGAYGSAEDIAKLFSYIIKYHPNLLEGTIQSAQNIISLDDVTHLAINTNKEIETLPGILGSKTGYTDIAGGNLAVAFEAGPMRPIVVVALGSTQDGRFTDIDSLVWATLKYIRDFDK